MDAPRKPERARSALTQPDRIEQKAGETAEHSRPAVVTAIPGSMFADVSGTFYRSVRSGALAAALAGSTAPGRYSSADQRVLYMSSSPEGVDAAMLAYKTERAEPSRLCMIEVSASSIFDLRSESSRALAGIDLEDAICDWKQALSDGIEPRSWAVARRLRSLGAHGLIDPSRKAPGLWHLALFDWNFEGAPSVRVIGQE